MTPPTDATVMILTTLMVLGLGTGIGVIINAGGWQSGIPPVSRLTAADRESFAGSGLRTLAHYDYDEQGRRTCRQTIKLSGSKAFYTPCP
jgi:hypothetical protein